MTIPSKEGMWNTQGVNWETETTHIQIKQKWTQIAKSKIFHHIVQLVLKLIVLNLGIDDRNCG